MQHGALHHALKAGGGLGVLAVVDHQGRQIVVEIFEQARAQGFEIDIARLHHLRGIGVVDESQQQMFKRRELVMALAREPDGPVQGLFETAR